MKGTCNALKAIYFDDNRKDNGMSTKRSPIFVYNVKYGSEDTLEAKVI
jgi:hypothetical protein